MRRTLSLALVALVAAAARPALAAPSPVSTTFRVTANVVKSCTVTAGDTIFGSYDPQSTSDLAVQGANIAVTCTKGTAITVAPLTTGGGFRMASATTNDRLNYSLYQDAAHTLDWSAQAATQSATSSKSAVNFAVYGVIAKGQDVGVASDYTDTVTVNVTF